VWHVRGTSASGIHIDFFEFTLTMLVVWMLRAVSVGEE